MSSLQKAIAYIEGHLKDEVKTEKIAAAVAMSPYYFQQGFQVITGYSVAEYIRCRRLYLAALEILAGRGKVIDVAYSYGYSTPDSFTKAFSRFHGVSPLQLREHPEKLRTFLPLKIKISIQGGDDMDYVVEKMEGFYLVGIPREVDFSSAYQEIPMFWNEFCQKHCNCAAADRKSVSEMERAIHAHQIGEYGVCMDDLPEKEKFRYLIAGHYVSGDIPPELEIVSFPAMEWAKFRCTGSLPAAMQAVNSRIFKEWLPNNPDYEICMGASLEHYTQGNTQAADYSTEIWIPVKRREE